jgi:hypothetical protein
MTTTPAAVSPNTAPITPAVSDNTAPTSPVAIITGPAASWATRHESSSRSVDRSRMPATWLRGNDPLAPAGRPRTPPANRLPSPTPPSTPLSTYRGCDVGLRRHALDPTPSCGPAAGGQATTVSGALAALLALPLIGLIDPIQPWLPSTLANAVAAMVDGAPASDYIPAVLITIIVIPAMLAWATRRVSRREL